MENRKGNVVIMTIAIVVAAIITAASVWLFVGSGIVSKQSQDVKSPVTKERSLNVKDSSGNADKVVFRDSDFQLTMPKEWDGYAAYLDGSGLGGKCSAINIFLPMKENKLKSFGQIWINDMGYHPMMKINVCDTLTFEEVLNSPECKEGPCPSVTSVIGRNESLVFTVDGSQDVPSDLTGEPYMVGLNFPENFNKYFKFELVSE